MGGRSTASKRGRRSNTAAKPIVRIYFTDYFGVKPTVLTRFGAFNLSLVNDLPLFIDPFLLFNSDKPAYRKLHAEIIEYVTFLREMAAKGPISKGLLKAWYTFPEVKQNWLGFSKVGNSGSGLGPKFATSLSKNLNVLFHDFGSESITAGSHLEKLCLIDEGVGRDNISDFTTNLIKKYLLDYTQKFALKHLRADQRRLVRVDKVTFSYSTRTWKPESFELPFWANDHVILTPRDMLTRDEAWINRSDLFHDFSDIVGAVPDDQLRAQLSQYFASRLPKPQGRKDKGPTRDDIHQAILSTIRHFPTVIDHYIRQKEQEGDKATAISAERVQEVEQLFLHRLTEMVQRLHRETAFYATPGDTLEEARARVLFLKDVIENKDGHKVFYGLDGKPVRREEVVQLLFRLTWYASLSDVNREVNNGRGPVDYKISRGAADSALVEFKLAKNSKLEQNLKHQVEVYKRANSTKKALKVIVSFTLDELKKVKRILKKLDIEQDPNVILIDADSRKKLSASNVRDR